MLMVALLVGAGAGASMNPEPSDRGGPENTLEVTPARVGAMSAIRWRAADRKPAPAQVTLRVVQLEKGREIFRLNPAAHRRRAGSVVSIHRRVPP